MVLVHAREQARDGYSSFQLLDRVVEPLVPHSHAVRVWQVGLSCACLCVCVCVCLCVCLFVSVFVCLYCIGKIVSVFYLAKKKAFVVSSMNATRLTLLYIYSSLVYV